MVKWASGRYVDLGLAVVLFVVAGYAIGDPPGPGYPGPGWVAWAVAAAVALPVVVRQRRPVAVVGAVVFAGAVATACGVAGGGMLVAQFLPAAVALCTVGCELASGRAITALVLSVLAAGVSIAAYYAARLPGLPVPSNSEVPLWAPGEIAVTATVLTAGWTVGVLVRWRRSIAARLAHSLAHAAILDERLRIARDLHDIIGHSMTVISVKATVANHLAATRPEEVRAALSVIEETSRTALSDIRRTLGLLRTAQRDGEPADLTPLPGLAQLFDLGARAEAAGVRVELALSGTDDVSDVLGLVAYRIVQEALTNVVRHAAPTFCRVAVKVDAAGLHIDVTDEGPGRPEGTILKDCQTGHGLVGMQERVSLYGGTMSAGPRPEGGFRVHAHLPSRPRRQP